MARKPSIFNTATQFHAVGQPFSDDVQLELNTIPGVVLAKDGYKAWTATNVAWTIAEYLGHMGVSYAVNGRMPVQYDHAKALIDAELLGRTCELHSWIWDKTDPTASEPIRLLDYQRNAIAWSIAMDSAPLWEGAGAGKTVQGLAWALAKPGSVLVVTRAGARETQRREAVRLSSVTPFAVKPKGMIKKKDAFDSLTSYLAWCADSSSRPYVIVGWEALAANMATLEQMDITSIIWDEIHRGKNNRRFRWVPTEDDKLEKRDRGNMTGAAYALACRSRRRLGTTATPIGHRLSDLWGQMTLIEPWSWGITASRFLRRYCDGKDGEFGGIEAVGMSNVDELKTRLAYSVFHVPREVSHAQLPEKRREVIRVSPEDQVNAKRWTKKALKEAVLEARTGSFVAKRRVQQVRLAEASGRKRRYIINDVKAWLADQPNAKIIVFTGLIKDCDELGDQLRKAKGTLKDVQVWNASGTTASNVRQEIQDAYMAHPGPCVLVGTYKAWGESLNLQDTDLLLVSMLPWTVDMVIQLEGRVFRLGMLRKVLIRYLIAEDTYDERIADILLSKLPAVETFTGDAMDGFGTQLSGIEFDLDDLNDMYEVM